MYPGDGQMEGGGATPHQKRGMGVERVGLRSLGATVTVLLAGRLLASVHFLCVNTIIYNSPLKYDRENPISVLYIYCTIPNRAEILSSGHVFLSDSSLLSRKGM